MPTDEHYAMIPETLVFAGYPAALTVYAVLDRAQRLGEVFASNDWLQTQARISVNTCKAALAWLMEAGYVVRIQAGGGHRAPLYKLPFRCGEERPGCQKLTPYQRGQGIKNRHPATARVSEIDGQGYQKLIPRVSEIDPIGCQKLTPIENRRKEGQQEGEQELENRAEQLWRYAVEAAPRYINKGALACLAGAIPLTYTERTKLLTVRAASRTAEIQLSYLTPVLRKCINTAHGEAVQLRFVT